MIRSLLCASLAFACLCGAAAPTATAQSATPVSRLDQDQFTQPWYEQARLPNKREKNCLSDNVILYSLNDKKNTFQFAISCLEARGNWNAWDFSGKLDPAGSGRLKLKKIWPLTSPYWVVSAAPDMQWMLVGAPNHKSLWLLSRTPTVSQDVITLMQSRAASQGFKTAKLIPVPQHEGALHGVDIAQSILPPNARPKTTTTTSHTAP